MLTTEARGVGGRLDLCLCGKEKHKIVTKGLAKTKSWKTLLGTWRDLNCTLIAMESYRRIFCRGIT